MEEECAKGIHQMQQNVLMAFTKLPLPLSLLLPSENRSCLSNYNNAVAIDIAIATSTTTAVDDTCRSTTSRFRFV